MYTTFFGLSENPFNLTPDPRYLFLSPYHKEALDHLLYGINERKGFITITGGIGTGKTTLCRALLSHLDGSTKSALIFNAFISDMELLKTINQEFGIDMGSGPRSKKDYIDTLNGFLIETFSQGGNAVLLIDEAQNLSHNVLEQIRMLSNLETEREKLLQIVLVGQSELKELLAAPAIRQLDERITVRYELKPLDSKDIQGYVAHRLVIAGGMGNLRFTKGAFRKVYSYSKGNPRRINAVCDRALLIAYAREKHTITKDMAGSAVQELHGNGTREPLVKDWSWRNFLSFSLLLFLLILVAGFAGWSSKENILGIFSEEEKKVQVERVVKASIPPPKPTKKEASLFLDEETSLAALFGLFRKRVEQKGQGVHLDEPLTLVSFDVDPEYYVMFRKPFRINLSGPVEKTPHYLLIREVTKEGAIAQDTEGKSRKVSRDFILNHWGQKVSCVYPLENKYLHLSKGMSTPEVSWVQRVLIERGYLVEETGTYDEKTLQAVLKFQRNLGLSADGIVGPQTMSLLFQVAD
ncbi:MAG: AAA family ATPase [Desulfobacteraceae bacterium]|jgi:general secretion pathway protein A